MRIVCGATGRMRNEQEIFSFYFRLEPRSRPSRYPASPIDHFRYMVLCAFNRCLQWNLLEQCTRGNRSGDASPAWLPGCLQQERCLQRSCGFACYLHFICIQIVTFTDTHTYVPLSPHLPSLSPAKTLTHVPLSTVIDIHLCVSRHTPFTCPRLPHWLLPSSCSARMNLIAQMCVKLYFCIRRQSHTHTYLRISRAEHGQAACQGGSTSCARCGCASCCYSGFPSPTVSQVCVAACVCVCA